MVSSAEQQVLNQLITILKEDFAAGKIFLFGSRAEGTATRDWDLEIAVDKSRPDIYTERTLTEKMEEAAGDMSVHLVYFKSADSELRERILTAGKIIFER